jgi:NDP-sugar pyrophosphorylase family protein
MTTLLICPSSRREVLMFSRHLPLAGVPLLGQSVLEYWLSALSLRGVGKAIVLAHEQPASIAEVVGKGQRWGLEATVITESRELMPEEALLKYASKLDPVPKADSIIVADHFPGLPERPLFTSYQGAFRAIRQWLPSALTVDRVGFSEARPGIWLGCHSHISPHAQLIAPCWVGRHVFIGAGALIGPGAIVEDGSFIEPEVELVESWVCGDTFVGRFAKIYGSVAWGNVLINWQTNSATEIADPFLLCALRHPRQVRSANWLKKLCDVYTRNKNEVGLLWKHLLLHKEG